MNKQTGGRHYTRQGGGNMLLLTLLSTALLASIFLIIGNVLAVIFAYQRLENQAEATSMSATRCLNAYDRAGRINNMTAACPRACLQLEKNLQRRSGDYPCAATAGTTLS